MFTKITLIHCHSEGIMQKLSKLKSINKGNGEFSSRNTLVYTSDHQYVHFMTICPFTLTILDPYRESNLNPDVLSLFARTRA